MAVPRYADFLEDANGVEEVNDGAPKSIYIKSRAAWRKELKKWIDAEQNAYDDDDIEPQVASGSKAWLPITLEKLFKGTAKKPLDGFLTKRAKEAITEERLMMEVIAAEYSDEAPDDGELEGSGDDYME